MVLLEVDITGADLVTTYKTLVFICGAILALWGFAKAVKEIGKPLVDMKKTVNDHTSEIKEINDHIKKSDEGMRVVQQGLLQIMNHMIDGNHQDKLVEARDKMQDYLTKK